MPPKGVKNREIRCYIGLLSTYVVAKGLGSKHLDPYIPLIVTLKTILKWNIHVLVS